MLWDNKRIHPVSVAPDQSKAVLLWLGPASAPISIAEACQLAAIDVFHLDDVERCLEFLARNKPALLVHDTGLTAMFPDFEQLVAAHRITETLPLLPYSSDLQNIAFGSLCGTTGRIDAFLTIRSLLRRARPSALTGIRCIGAFRLDEAGFRLFYEDKCANISKADLCVLGPFFDVKNAVFDRLSLSRLVLGTAADGNNIRSIDVIASRMRRNVKQQVGVDPLRSVRGLGFTLKPSASPAMPLIEAVRFV